MTSAVEFTPNAAFDTIDSVVQVRQLHKHYGRLAAVRGIDFSVAPGELFGLIGPDGAGKTTTFHILGGIMEATAGEVQVLGLQARDARLQIGYLTQQFSLYLDLSIDENLQYVAGLREVPEQLFQQRRAKYLKLMSLDRFGDRLAGQLSGGMKQKLALCCALVSQPKVLLLDEPTTGVDPVSRREFWDVLAALAAEGVTIVVATPYLDEAERCNRVALMYDGMIQQLGTPAELRQSLGLHRLEVHTPQLEIAEQALSGSSGIADVQTFGDRLDVLVADPNRGEGEIREQFRDRHLALTSIHTAEPTLENVFVTRLRQQGSAPQFLEFPRGRSGRKSPQDTAIYAHNLDRVFGTFQAVKNVNVEVRYGEIFGLLGANGAGKTTTIKMLCGLLPASSGDISLGGERGNLRSSDLRKRIGYMSQKFTLYDDLSIVQNLEFYSGVYGVPRKLRREKIDWVLATCGLEGQENMLTGQLPGGWKQRVAFGASVLHEPDILFLDEPTSGVDPLARRQFWRLINDFARNGTAILVTTHYLEEAEQCNRMSFMVAGETVLEGSPNQVKAAQPGQLIEIVIDQTQAASNLLKQQMESWRVSIFADRLHVVIDHPEEIEELRSRLLAAHLSPHSLLPIPYSLEDAFIGVVQRAQNKL
ncbi:ATP-binding cassette domain-containing protein [Leptolyngbya sp. NIES-2104]|uniref:ATP-binding cassette domain-containing protein n=1 Tax=Leptolyngbya sp. NIES-2104 TaxID=1552121 RepID=UPI0006EC5B73|nr:ATP-binding cassette domain-containing protein [Leptolyngbya sp. NIES-2104]GAP99216.1 putative ABC transporter ATP-binding protein [Leptolyngbya sp. NIES-2104]